MRMSALHTVLPLALLAIAPTLLAGDAWPDYRGPGLQGHAVATNLPTDFADDRNVVWKTPIHDTGWSTPVVLGDQVWVTTATMDGKKMWAVGLDRATGKVLHDILVFENDTVEPLGNTVNCYAAPSPVIEPGRVYVHFGSYGTACIDAATGKVLWQRRDLPCLHSRGPGSSPVLFDNLLILTLDGIDQQYTVALNKATGETVWRKERGTKWDDVRPDGTIIGEGDTRKAYNTPVFIQHAGQPAMISVGSKAAYCYDPRDGRQIWNVTYKGFSNASRPVVAHDLAFLNTGYMRPDLVAVKLGGNGDVTGSNIAWTYSKNVSHKPSPLVVDDLLYMIDDSGVVTCLDARTGGEIYKQRLGGKHSASPIFADGKLWFFSEEGKVATLAPGREYKVLSETQLPDGFMSSPAVAGNALYLRTKTHLYRIETKPAAN